jgi:hypothetical protein
MKRCVSVMLVGLLLAGHVFGADVTTFTRVKVADPKGSQTAAKLLLDDTERKLVVEVADRALVTISYADLDKVSYQYSRRFRLTEGALVALAVWPVGGVVMLTKSKSHWLYLEYHEGQVSKSIVLRMHKDEYKQILEAMKTHTGKDVVVVVEEKPKGQNKPQKNSGKDK